MLILAVFTFTIPFVAFSGMDTEVAKLLSVLRRDDFLSVALNNIEK